MKSLVTVAPGVAVYEYHLGKISSQAAAQSWLQELSEASPVPNSQRAGLCFWYFASRRCLCSVVTTLLVRNISFYSVLRFVPRGSVHTGHRYLPMATLVLILQVLLKCSTPTIDLLWQLSLQTLNSNLFLNRVEVL